MTNSHFVAFAAMAFGLSTAAAAIAVAVRPTADDGTVVADQPSPPPGAASGVRPTVPDYHILPDQLQAWLDAATPGERAIFADGILTFEEYESAVFETLACIEEAGLTVAHSNGYGRAHDVQPGPRLSSRGVYSYFGQVTTYSPTRPAKEFAALAECKQLSAQVEFMWAQHTAPSQVDLQAMRDHMAECLRTLGMTVPERPGDRELQAVLRPAHVSQQEYDSCRFQAADTFEIDSLPG